MDRPDLMSAGHGRLSFIERTNLRLVRETFSDGLVGRSLPWLQRHVGAVWIGQAVRRVLRVHGADRLPPLRLGQSYLCVANHRSFFDMYVITSWLVGQGLLPHRIVFPVRSSFFYDNPAGLLVNGLMSFFAMYPPIYRDKRKAVMNVLALDEIIWLLKRGDTFCGIHPEGTRKQDDDPYTFLPPQRGVGRIIHETQVPVVPVFIHGLSNDLHRQLRQGMRGTAQPVYVVFGEPLHFAKARQQPGSPRLHRVLADEVMARVGALGQEEKALRAAAQEPPAAVKATG